MSETDGRSEYKGHFRFQMKVSIVTAALNAAQTISDCIKSVSIQTHEDIEHIIVDGGSADDTILILDNYNNNISWSSEPDGGIYDAMNKGLHRATGDIIGFLNSDDMYSNELVIETVVAYLADPDMQTCYGDILYVDRNKPDKVIRRWICGTYQKNNFKKGWMPPHPAFFVKKNIYEEYGGFNLNFRLASDYEIMLRLLYKYGISTVHIPMVMVKMRTGGRCRPGLKTTSVNVVENYRAWKVNDLPISPLTFVLKPLSKIFQYF